MIVVVVLLPFVVNKDFPKNIPRNDPESTKEFGSPPPKSNHKKFHRNLATSCVEKVGGMKLQFSDCRQLQISDSGDTGAQNFNCAIKQIQNLGLVICYCWDI